MWKWIIYSIIFLKKISRLVSPTGQEIIPVQVYSCGNCGHINTKLNPTHSSTK